jgi:hypothetical protein
MEAKYLVPVLVGISYAIAVANKGRTPENIMKDERPTTQSFITRKTPADAISIIMKVAEESGFHLHKAEPRRAIFTSNMRLFSWGYVLMAEAESPNDWSTRVSLSLYLKAETGYGNSFVSNKNLKKLVESTRSALLAEQL